VSRDILCSSNETPKQNALHPTEGRGNGDAFKRFEWNHTYLAHRSEADVGVAGSQDEEVAYALSRNYKQNFSSEAANEKWLLYFSMGLQ
jgi:hypothetical protein